MSTFFFLFPNRFNTLPSETSRGKTIVLLFLNNNSSVLIRVSSLSMLAQICVMVKSHQRIKYNEFAARDSDGLRFSKKLLMDLQGRAATLCGAGHS